MAFCGNCGTQLASEGAQCGKCGGINAQYYQPMPYYPPQGPSPDKDVGKALGIVALIVIVIVVIIVILALIAFFYIVVVGFGGTGDMYYSTPVGAWNSVDATSSTTAELHFGTFSTSVAPTDIMVYVREDGTSAGHLVFTGDTIPTPATMNWIDGPSGASAEYMDYNYHGGLINAGDYITLEGLNPDTQYTIELYYIPSDSTIAMTGDGTTFTTEP